MYIHPPLTDTSAHIQENTSKVPERNKATHQQKVLAIPQNASTSTRPVRSGAGTAAGCSSIKSVVASSLELERVRRRAPLVSLTAPAVAELPKACLPPSPSLAGGYRCASHWRARRANRGVAVSAIRIWKTSRGPAWSPILSCQFRPSMRSMWSSSCC